MNINLASFNNLFIAIDKGSDYIPGISSLTNICCIFQKGILSLTSKKGFVENNYTSHVYHKNLSRCLIACVPILGNITLAIYDDQKIVEGRELPKTDPIQELVREITELKEKNKNYLRYAQSHPLPRGGVFHLAPQYFLELEELTKKLALLDPHHPMRYNPY
ncbi:hypothetical protein [Candidatus Rhabdochlamydia sp. T3358]|uniref:hypothetical protein n=1 Tax=Candidatus Rhabdochlamydia sp. T3358 TaxID=2099795 RepID=UPI0010AFEA48|nr:hypothetical protein [Candidatus Rhabdochlamydia sp. T3358]VHO03987.1 hypothetical protein RHT_01151 [Candidatus Rhabdochlamydia sp. T3358]